MSAKWGSLTTFKFVEEYRQQRCLWDPQDKDYKSKDARDAALSEIVRNMNIEGFDMLAARKKVRTVRSTYWNEKAKILRSMASARYTESTYKPKLLWYTLADEFLKVTVTARESLNHSNVENDDYDDTVMFIKEECHTDETNDEPNIKKPTDKVLSKVTSDSEQANKIHKPKAPKPGQLLTEDANESGGRGKPNECTSCNLSDIFRGSIANRSEEHEFDLFGRSVACHLKKLSEKDALELEMEILNLILTRRLKLHSQS